MWPEGQAEGWVPGWDCREARGHQELRSKPLSALASSPGELRSYN